VNYLDPEWDSHPCAAMLRRIGLFIQIHVSRAEKVDPPRKRVIIA
jgi:hypothetical protein